jgi:hypothetical protein
MAPWQAYGHRHVHGIGLETAQGHADIEGGYADQHLRVTVQVGAQPAQHRRVATMAQAQAWAEACPCRRVRWEREALARPYTHPKNDEPQRPRMSRPALCPPPRRSKGRARRSRGRRLHGSERVSPGGA